MRKLLTFVLAVYVLASFSFSPIFAITPNSFEFNVNGIQWLNNGKSFEFNGVKNEKCIMGKYYIEDSGKLTFDFYDADGKLVLTHTKLVESNPEKDPFARYTFDLDKDYEKGYLKEGAYTVKVSTTPNSQTWGWLNY